MGPSPRVRGSRRPGRRGRAPGRSIPACAGKPRPAGRSAPSRRVHPRVCGEAGLRHPADQRPRGPSPRVRGSHRGAAAVGPGTGSIPACAGKPSRFRRRTRERRVHPRVCGEAVTSDMPGHAGPGPSPRVRGSPAHRGPGAARGGSIPACAGKPASPTPYPCPGRVHPRVCGEAVRRRRALRPRAGPSPRVRGSRGYVRLASDPDGSIPACAGKPSPPAATGPPPRVHPRVCGEASSEIIDATRRSGPSPRVRGSPPCAGGPRVGGGSIPACAGKPRPDAAYRNPVRVHPRVCGEAVGRMWDGMRTGGPSPRVRGSRDRRSRRQLPDGSIPACAGKPWSRRKRSGRSGVHPRVCGEARGARPARAALAGSIPACAGKPPADPRGVTNDKVHPRVCGEASGAAAIAGRSAGPSPRVRGSLSSESRWCIMMRSIPACAGKPRPARGSGSR